MIVYEYAQSPLRCRHARYVASCDDQDVQWNCRSVAEDHEAKTRSADSKALMTWIASRACSLTGL